MRGMIEVQKETFDIMKTKEYNHGKKHDWQVHLSDYQETQTLRGGAESSENRTRKTRASTRCETDAVQSMEQTVQGLLRLIFAEKP